MVWRSIVVRWLDVRTARAHSLDRLNVVDASYAPAQRANINLPRIMLAERISDLIIADLRS